MYKVIGKFQELDGIEKESLSEIKKELGLIGSLSADVGNIELYYTDDGNTYAITKDSEYYYGNKGDTEDIIIARNKQGRPRDTMTLGDVSNILKEQNPNVLLNDVKLYDKFLNPIMSIAINNKKKLISLLTDSDFVGINKPAKVLSDINFK